MSCVCPLRILTGSQIREHQAALNESKMPAGEARRDNRHVEATIRKLQMSDVYRGLSYLVKFGVNGEISIGDQDPDSNPPPTTVRFLYARFTNVADKQNPPKRGGGKMDVGPTAGREHLPVMCFRGGFHLRTCYQCRSRACAGLAVT